MSLLNLKLALAFQRRRLDHARHANAMAHFLEDHLGRWAEPFGPALADADAAPAYRAMGRLLARAVETGSPDPKGPRHSRRRAGAGKDPIGGEELVCPFARHNGHDASSGQGAFET